MSGCLTFPIGNVLFTVFHALYVVIVKNRWGVPGQIVFPAREMLGMLAVVWHPRFSLDSEYK